MAEVLKSNQGALFIQTDGANTMPRYLPQSDLDDIEESLGGITLMQAFDANGNFVTLGHIQDAPEPISTTITTYLSELADHLDRLKGCPFALYIMMRCTGRADVFTNYRRGFVLEKAIPTGKGLMGLVKRNEPAASEHSIDIEAYPPLWRIFEVNDARIQVANTTPIREITFCGEFRCASYCADPSSVCQDGYYVTESETPTSFGSPAEVYYTNDGGATWTQTTADPFTVGNISSVQCFRIGQRTTRVLVANGSSITATPASVAYSDDNGATWTAVTVGDVDTQFITKLFALGLYNIWAVTNDGFIYFSEDGGATWTAQESGSITSTDYLDIDFLDENYGVAVGEGDIIAITRDGGSTWSEADADTGSADDITSVKLLNRRTFWVGTDGGDLFYTNDFAESFAQRTTFVGSGTGTITAMDWITPLFGVVVHNGGDGYGRLHLTINGGYDWTQVSTSASAGLLSVFMCDPNLFFTAGTDIATVGVLIKVSN